MAKLSGDARDRPLGRRDIEGNRAAGQLIRRDASKNDMRISDGGFPANSIAGRAGDRARAFRPNPQTPAGVDSCDGTATRAHRVDVEHRHTDREVIDPCFGC